MILPFLLIGLVALAVVLALLFGWRRMRHRRTRIQLRLLAGRSRLLAEELTDRSGELETGFDKIESACAAARNSLDQLQVAILDRQAQLQNYEDLASLQRHKLAVLEYAQRQLPEPGEDQPTLDGEAAAQFPRERLEQTLLDKIDGAREAKEEE